jgi:hypothetical protein
MRWFAPGGPRSANIRLIHRRKRTARPFRSPPLLEPLPHSATHLDLVIPYQVEEWESQWEEA